MLPPADAPDFPAALKAARLAQGMSRSALAKAANIHAVMPRRYEEPDCGEFAKPTPNTWAALNRALGFTTHPSTSLSVEEVTSESSKKFLCDASIEDIVAELKKRHISVTMSFSA